MSSPPADWITTITEKKGRGANGDVKNPTRDVIWHLFYECNNTLNITLNAVHVPGYSCASRDR